MTGIVRTISDWGKSVVEAWDRFWFTPAQPHTLALLRILSGGMLFYTFAVWSLDLESFLGADSWINNDTAKTLQSGGYAWSYLWHVDSPGLLWTLHLIALAIIGMFTLGLFTRYTAVLSWLITVAYSHRLNGALFGLDQVNAMLVMYLMIGPCGAVYSLDRLLRRRRGLEGAEPQATISGNVSIRLLQLHLCIIYLFGGISKMRGEMWWDGSAAWYAIANLEYQSLDMTWIARWPWMIALITHVTVFWEAYYIALVWPRKTRPVALGLALLVHGGIALSLGMITFGLAMIIGNLAFVGPRTVRLGIDRLLRRTAGGRA